MEKKPKSAPLTPSQLAERYIKESILRPDTIRHYRLVAHVLERDIGQRSVGEIHPDLLLRWRANLIRRAEPTTWNNYRTNLSVLWNFAIRKKWVAENPFLEVRRAPVLLKGKKTVSEDLLASAVSLLQHSDEAPRPGWFWLIVIKVLYFTGMRRRQLTTMRWSHVDFQKNTILLVAEGCKTRREWTIPLPADCVDDLLYLRQRTLAVNSRALVDDHQVFRVQLFNERYKGRELSPNQLGGFFRRLSDGLTGRISSHRLRHTMATELAKAENASLKYLQQILGHTDMRTTMEYVHPDPDQLRQFMNQLRLPSAKTARRLRA